MAGIHLVGGIRIRPELHRQAFLLCIHSPQWSSFHEVFGMSKWKIKQEIKSRLPLKLFLATGTENNVIFFLWQIAACLILWNEGECESWTPCVKPLAMVVNRFYLRGTSLVAQKVENLPVDIGDAGAVPGLGRSPWAGNGNPPQCSHLENPMDRGTWWATVHGSQRVRMTEHTHTMVVREEMENSFPFGGARHATQGSRVLCWLGHRTPKPCPPMVPRRHQQHHFITQAMWQPTGILEWPFHGNKPEIVFRVPICGWNWVLSNGKLEKRQEFTFKIRQGKFNIIIVKVESARTFYFPEVVWSFWSRKRLTGTLLSKMLSFISVSSYSFTAVIHHILHLTKERRFLRWLGDPNCDIKRKLFKVVFNLK